VYVIDVLLSFLLLYSLFLFVRANYLVTLIVSAVSFEFNTFVRFNCLSITAAVYSINIKAELLFL